MDRCRRNEKIRRCQGGGRVGMLEDGGSCMCRDELTLFSRDVVYTRSCSVVCGRCLGVRDGSFDSVCSESNRVAKGCLGS